MEFVNDFKEVLFDKANALVHIDDIDTQKMVLDNNMFK